MAQLPPDRPSQPEASPLAPLRAQVLAPTAPPAGAPNPALIYHEAKSKGSRPAIRAVLGRIAGWLTGLPHAATWEEVVTLPWWEVRAHHVQVLRGRLAEVSAPRTVNRDLSVLRSVLTIAWETGQMPSEAYQRATHVKGVEKDKTKAGRALEPAELRALMRACQEFPAPREGARAAAVLTLLYAAGLRRVEVAKGVSFENVDFDSGHVKVLGKRRRYRTARTAPGWVKYLRAWRDVRGDIESGLLFDFSTAETVARIIEEIRLRAGVKEFTPHDLRRSFGTHLLGAKRDINLVKELLGHDDIRTTIIYDRRDDAALDEAVSSLPSPCDDEERNEDLARLIIPSAPKRSYDLKEIFNFQGEFGDNDIDNIEWLRAELQAGNATMEMVQLPTQDAYDKRLLAEFSGNTAEHRVLCVQAAHWFLAHGWKCSGQRDDCTYRGGIADVADLAGRVFVECGNTQSLKILKALEGKQTVMVVPYLHTRPTIGFWFKPKPKRTLLWAKEPGREAQASRAATVLAHQMGK